MIVENEALTEAPETDPQMEARARLEKRKQVLKEALEGGDSGLKEAFEKYPKQRERFEQELASVERQLASGNFEAPALGKQVSKREAYSEQASPEFKTGPALFPEIPAREAKPKRKGNPLPEGLKGHYFKVWDGLLSGKHTGKMGKSSSVWTFLWCVEHTTSEEVNGLGEVLHSNFPKRAVKIERIAKDLGFSEEKVRKDLKVLKSGGYIQTTKAQKGLKIWVCKSKRVFKDKASKAGSVQTYRTEDSRPVQKDRTETQGIPGKVFEGQGNRQN